MKVFWFSLLASFVFFSSVSQSAPTSSEVPYYGEQFYHDLAGGISNDDLKNSIRLVLRSSHLKVQGTYDQIVPSCDGDSCYKHVSLGYDRARIFLLGKYYLVDDSGSYGIRDVYCNTVRPASDFKNGKAPYPNTIPDGAIVNTEHTWPQSRFSGRHDKNMQKSDMHHLFPTDNEMNSYRGNNPFGEVVKDNVALRCPESRFGKPSYGSFDVFQPPANHRGNVARALFYFSVRYDLNIDPKQEVVLRKWSKEDPVDAEEIARNNEIHKAQGNRNPFIDVPGLEGSIFDF